MVCFTYCMIMTDFYIGSWAEEDNIEDEKANFKMYLAYTISFATGTGVFVAARASIIFFMSIKASTILHE